MKALSRKVKNLLSNQKYDRRTDRQTDRRRDRQTDGRRTIRIYHDFIQGQGNPPECQRFALHDEACRVVYIANFCPCTKSWLIIFLLPLSISITNPLFLLSKTTSKRFLLRKWRQLGLIMTSRHCMIYDVTG